MPADVMSTLRSRLDHAQEHIETLRTEERAFVDSDAYEVTLETDRETGDGYARVRVKREPPLRLSLIIGDCVHNVRSTLDHIAWHLAVQNVGQPRWPKRIHFPICLSETGPKQPRFADERKTALKEFLPQAHPVFEALQPYHRLNDPENHPLWVLNELWNWDKHRHLHLVGTLSRDSSIAVVSTNGRVSDLKIYNGRLEDGTILGRWRASPPDADGKLEGNHTFHMVFDDQGPARGGITVDTLAAIHHHARHVVLPRFSSYLR